MTHKTRSVAVAAVLGVLAFLGTGCSSSTQPAHRSSTSDMSMPPMTSGGPTSGATSAATTSASTTGAANAQRITVHTTNALRFEPATIDARVGTVRITIVDDGSYPHNMSLTSLKKTSATVSGDPGADRTTFTLTFTKAGTYPFVCTYHASAGMRGRITVT